MAYEEHVQQFGWTSSQNSMHMWRKKRSLKGEKNKITHSCAGEESDIFKYWVSFCKGQYFLHSNDGVFCTQFQQMTNET